jgi:hypothetical protein
MLHERMVSEVNCFHGLVIFTGAFRPAVHCEHSDVPNRNGNMLSLFQMRRQRIILQLSRFPQIRHSLLVIRFIDFGRCDVAHAHICFGSLLRSEHDLRYMTQTYRR